MTFIPKFHILAPRSKKSENVTSFGHISGISEDFLTEKEKNDKNENVSSFLYLF